jgi:hypothetical protein
MKVTKAKKAMKAKKAAAETPVAKKAMKKH